MNILILFLLAAFPPASKDSLYSHSEEQCAFIYTKIRKWDLTLKEQGTFYLKYSHRDTRYERKSPVDFYGFWKKINDTIILTIVYPLENDCYLKNARFIQSKDTLNAFPATSVCLPQTLERVQRFSEKRF